jgi:hypothetical protein
VATHPSDATGCGVIGWIYGDLRGFADFAPIAARKPDWVGCGPVCFGLAWVCLGFVWGFLGFLVLVVSWSALGFLGICNMPDFLSNESHQ